MRNRRRLALDVEPGTLAALARVEVATESTTHAEAFRRAINLADAVIAHIAKGGKVILRSPDGTEETVRII